MSVVSVVVGAVTQDSARVVAKVDGGGPVRLLVADNPDMTGGSFYGPVSVDTQGVAAVTITGLSADADWWYRVEDGGVVDVAVTGRFRTHPLVGQPADFTVAVIGDAGLTPETPGSGIELAPDRISNHPAFTAVLEQDALLTVHLGDICYYNPGDGVFVPDGSVATYRAMWDDILNQSRQAELYRQRQLVYVWDDHDYGPNDSDGTLVTKGNAAQAYRERIPSYSLPDAAGAIYQAFHIGRALFVVSDTRYHRSPNSDPDTSSKTMLGADQKAWLNSVLASSDAELLVWLMPTPWLGTIDDTWGGFTVERQELVEMVRLHGWDRRMCMVSADVHALGIASAAGNLFGGWPVYLAASIDATPSEASGAQYDLGFQPGRNQHATVRINDQGDRIDVTYTGWIGTEVWRAHTFTVVVEAPEPPPPPPPPPQPIAEARIRRRITWLGVHAVTGRIIAELPDVRGSVGRLLSAYSSHHLQLPIPLAGPGRVPIELVEQATQPITSAIVAVVNDLPVWMGWVLSRQGGTDAMLSLATVTPEGYLRRRRVRSHAFEGEDRALVAAALVEDAGAIEGVGAGLGFTVDAVEAGERIDRTYVATDRAVVYDALRELCSTGLEFTVDLDWADASMTTVRKILRLRSRIGKAANGNAPLFETSASSMFDSRAGSEATYRLTEDASTGRMANYVVAIAPGEGEDQPASDPAVNQVALAGGAPIIEHVVEVSSAATDAGSLDSAAAAELALLRHGAQVWDISTRLDAYPRLGVDVGLGDDVAWLLTGHRHPRGVTGSGRMVGYEVDQQAGRWRPILLNPQEATL